MKLKVLSRIILGQIMALGLIGYASAAPEGEETAAGASDTVVVSEEADESSSETKSESSEDESQSGTPGDTASDEPADTQPSDANAMKTAAPLPLASEKELKQKASYGDMLYISGSAKRVNASDNAEAKALMATSKEKLQQAKNELNAGNLRAAQDLIDESMRMFNSAAMMVPSDSVLQEQRARYDAIIKEYEQSRESYKATYDKRVAKDGASAGVKIDEKEVDRLAQESRTLYQDKKYPAAIDAISKALTTVNGAISQMLDKQTVTYDLKIDTPEGEWKYELDRFIGYEELVPVAIEERKPNAGQLMLVNKKVEKAHGMAEKAKETAAAGSYPKAIAMIGDATKEIRAALRIMGITE